MAKPKETGDWYYDSGRHQEDLERDLAALNSRVDELKATPGAEPAQIEQAETAVKAAKENLQKLYGTGQKQAQRRPRKAAETRKK